MILNQKIKYSNALALASYAILLILMVTSTLLSTLPEEASRGLMLAVKCLPLIIFLPGLLKGSLRTHMWLCFVVLFYFTRAVVDAFLTEGALLESLTTAITVTLFIASMMYVRWQKQAGIPL